MKKIRESNYLRAKSMQLTLKWHLLVIVSVKKKLGSISRIRPMHIRIRLYFVSTHARARTYICKSYLFLIGCIFADEKEDDYL